MIYSADMVELVLKFANDTKGGKKIRGEADRHRLQNSLNELCNWADKWEMCFNVVKCHVEQFASQLHHVRE